MHLHGLIKGSPSLYLEDIQILQLFAPYIDILDSCLDNFIDTADAETADTADASSSL